MKVCVVGNFGDGTILTDGQGIKTLELYNALCEYYGEQSVCKVNLYNQNKILLVFKLLIALFKCKNLIVLVSKNGRKKLIPLLVSMNKLFKRKIFHSLIGSTTHETLDEKHKYVECFNSLAGNWAETLTEKKLLEERGLTNVSVVKNFKNLSILNPSDLIFSSNEPFSFCTFSRVEEMKGIPNIVKAINCVNERFGRIVCTLDIYGKVMDNYLEEFEEIQKTFGVNIKYCGVIDFDKSVEALKKYYMLVFPTKYYTEGIPGTILDAFAAGVPVISSEWESCFDIMSDSVGITYEFKNDEALVSAITYAINNPCKINLLKENCLIEAKKYSSQEIIKNIGGYLA